VGLAPYVPRLVASWPPGEHVHEPVDGSLVSVDISGFTALSERLGARGKAGAEELIERISSTYSALIERTEAYGGDVLKFRGDALLLYFGEAQHAQRAATAAIEMQATIAAQPADEVELRMACAIWSGRCDFFLVGSSHHELIVAGPGATAVLRLEDEASAGEILIAEGTARELGVAPGALLTESPFATAAPALPPEPTRPLAELVPGPLRPVLEADAAESEHRLATVAFLKFSGTDGLVAEQPERAAAQFAELGRVVGEAADAVGITWLESDIDIDGGKLYLVAGAPSTRGDEEERMLVALRRILDAGLSLPVRAGVNRGHVFAGTIGADVRQTYAVMGDVVNTAARLVSRAEPGQLLVTDDVLQRARSRFEVDGQPFLMKGKERPVTAYSVGPVAGVRSSDEQQLALIGRADELAELQAALDAARTRQMQVIELVGEPGLGKSRLVEELRTAAVGFQILEAHGEEYAASEPYAALRPLLRPLAGIRAEDDAETAGAHLAAFAPAVVPDLLPWLPLLAIAFGADVPDTPETTDLNPSFRRERLLDVVDAFLTRMLLVPTLLIVEDAHWLDDASRELLRRIVSSPAPRPWLLLATRRPEGLALGGKEIQLRPLADAAATELIALAAGDDPIPAADLALIAERAGGNPLFARELLAAHSDGSAGELPETVETLITTRIDRLSPNDRQLLRSAAVIGPSFDLALLEQILPDEQFEAGSTRLARLGEFVAVDEDSRVHFRHALFRAVAYEGLNYGRRGELHGEVARVLERLRGNEGAALLSMHFFEAGEYQKAWEYSTLAGDRARAGYANVDAADLYDRALAAAEQLADVPSSDIARIAESLGDVRELAGRYDDAASAYRLARHMLGDQPLDQARLLSKTGVLLEHDARYADAIAEQEEALGLLERAGVEDDALEARLQLAIAGARYRQGKFEECIAWCGLAVGAAERSSARHELAHAYYLLDVATTQLGRADQRYRELALPIYEEVDDLVGQASVLNNLGVGAYYEGRWDEAVEFYRRAEERSARAGDVLTAAMARNNEAEILSDQGHLDEAQALFAEALRDFRAAKHRAVVAACMSNIGRCAARAGRFDEAHELLEEALRDAEAFGARELALDARARIAECLVFEGRHREAFATATAALEEAGESEANRALCALLERLRGLAEAQDRAPERARAHFAESVRLARKANADLEEALTVAAASAVGLEAPSDRDAVAVLERFGVVASPRIPLP
jgi:class 3 adenylate cyclase/tetratricopeptide (TPR) repeat protein